MKIKFDYIERHTAKATLFIRGDLFAWLPKSTYKITNTANNELDVIDGFEIVWKNDSGQIVLKEGEPNTSSRHIIINEANKSDIWEYI